MCYGECFMSMVDLALAESTIYVHMRYVLISKNWKWIFFTVVSVVLLSSHVSFIFNRKKLFVTSVFTWISFKPSKDNRYVNTLLRRTKMAIASYHRWNNKPCVTFSAVQNNILMGSPIWKQYRFRLIAFRTQRRNKRCVEHWWCRFNEFENWKKEKYENIIIIFLDSILYVIANEMKHTKKNHKIILILLSFHVYFSFCF